MLPGAASLSRLLVWAYWLVAALYIVGVLLGWGGRLNPVAAILLLPILAAYMWLKAAHKEQLETRLLLGALLMGTLCDATVELTQYDMAYYGYMIYVRTAEYILLSVVFLLEVNRGKGPSFIRRSPWVLAWLGILAFIILWLTWRNLEALRVTILTNLATLLLLNIAIVNRLRSATEQSFLWTLAGVVVFDVSNALAAVTHFLYPIPYALALIQLTYALAHYWLVRGFLLQQKEERALVDI